MMENNESLETKITIEETNRQAVREPSGFEAGVGSGVLSMFPGKGMRQTSQAV